jgi:hypothetical protein
MFRLLQDLFWNVVCIAPDDDDSDDDWDAGDQSGEGD